MKTLRESLANGNTVFVRFEKANGEIRNMICTQNISMIPRTLHPSKASMVYDRSQIRVFDLVAKQWRSMIESRVVEYSEYSAQVA